MQSSGNEGNQRRGKRAKAVLPVRVKGKDRFGKPFEELVHTLDMTTSGVRLGAVHFELNVLDEVMVFYRQRRIQFRVVWTKQLKGTSEFQVGLKAVAQEREAWGLGLSDGRSESASQTAVSQATGAV